MLVALVLFLIEISIGVMYPAYKTLSLIASTSDSDYKTSYKNWSFYWIAFALLESISVYLTWLPFAVLKVGLLVFMAVPKLNGSEVIYDMLNDNALPVVQRGVSKVKEVLGN